MDRTRLINICSRLGIAAAKGGFKEQPDLVHARLAHSILRDVKCLPPGTEERDQDKISAIWAKALYHIGQITPGGLATLDLDLSEE